MNKEFAIGAEFVVPLTDLHLGSTEYAEAEFCGPEDSENIVRFVLMAREADCYAEAGPGRCILRGKIPAAASPGEYKLSRLVIHQQVGPGWSQEWPQAQLPDVTFVVTANASDLPTGTVPTEGAGW